MAAWQTSKDPVDHRDPCQHTLPPARPTSVGTSSFPAVPFPVPAALTPQQGEVTSQCGQHILRLCLRKNEGNNLDNSGQKPNFCINFADNLFQTFSSLKCPDHCSQFLLHFKRQEIISEFLSQEVQSQEVGWLRQNESFQGVLPCFLEIDLDLNQTKSL